MVIWLERGADLHIAQRMPLPLTVSCFSKIQIGFPFWYRLTWVVPDKGPLNVCVCVCAESHHSPVLLSTCTSPLQYESEFEPVFCRLKFCSAFCTEFDFRYGCQKEVSDFTKAEVDVIILKVETRRGFRGFSWTGYPGLRHGTGQPVSTCSRKWSPRHRPAFHL